MLGKARVHVYPDFDAGWYAFIGLYKGPCVHENGGVFLSGVTESLKVFWFYRAFVRNSFNRVYFHLGAMQSSEQ